ncbi:hypothetical protein V1524DRAFT_456886 [Lipomyces starkeyi]
MVGIAGGSRGCANYKARKIKCNEEFPQCHRCVISGRECGGSIMGPVFRKQRLRGFDGTSYISSVTDSTIIHPSKPRKRRRRMAQSHPHLIQVPEMSQTQLPPTRSLKSISSDVNGKRVYHKLFDLLLEIPQYDERLEQLFVPCRNRDIGTRQPVLKSEFLQRSVYDELAAMDTKLENLTERFEQWFVEYTANAKSFAKQDVSLAVTDSYIRAITSRCPAAADDEEWHSTHFFKPLISCPTSYDARLIGIYYAAWMMLIQMVQHIRVFKVMHQHGYRDPSAVLVSPGLEMFLIHTSRNMAELAVLICRSCPQMQSEKYGFAILNLTLSLRLASRALRDPLDRGWIWDQLLSIDEYFPSLCFGDDIPNETMQQEWHIYKQQPYEISCGLSENIGRVDGDPHIDARLLSGWTRGL